MKKVTVMTNKEFIELLNEKQFTAHNYGDYFDELHDELTAKGTSLDEHFADLGPYEEVEEYVGLDECFKVVYFSKYDKHVRFYGEYNSYESMAEWTDEYGSQASWEVVKEVEVLTTQWQAIKD